MLCKKYLPTGIPWKCKHLFTIHVGKSSMLTEVEGEEWTITQIPCLGAKTHGFGGDWDCLTKIGKSC